MHQSIPAVPIPPPPPPGNRGAFAHVVFPGCGASWSGDWALAYPGASPGHLTRVFSKVGRVYRERRGLCQRLACLNVRCFFRYL